MSALTHAEVHSRPLSDEEALYVRRRVLENPSSTLPLYVDSRTGPAIRRLEFEGDESGNVSLVFQSDKKLSSVEAVVDGPNTNSVYTFRRPEFNETGNGPYVYTLSYTQPYDDGEGFYVAAVRTATGKDGNPQTGSVPTNYYNTTEPSLQSATLEEDGTTFTLVYDEPVVFGGGHDEDDIDVSFTRQ